METQLFSKIKKEVGRKFLIHSIIFEIDHFSTKELVGCANSESLIATRKIMSDAK